jgi:hypothetical protein
MIVTGPGQQRSMAELTADIRARRRTALVVNVRSRRDYPTVCRQLHTAGLDLRGGGDGTLREVLDSTPFCDQLPAVSCLPMSTRLPLPQRRHGMIHSRPPRWRGSGAVHSTSPATKSAPSRRSSSRRPPTSSARTVTPP